MGNAAMSPLGDLNIVRTDIPAVLTEAEHQPYQLPADRSCFALGAEIAKLDLALGADFDAQVPKSSASPSLLDRGSDFAEDQAVGAVKRTAEGLVPFRGWVRKLSGAERYDRQVSQAKTAGSVRRAFLKGIAVSEHCTEQPQMHASLIDALE